FVLTCTATPAISALSLHDALPICRFTVDNGSSSGGEASSRTRRRRKMTRWWRGVGAGLTSRLPLKSSYRFPSSGNLSRSSTVNRSEEHTSELQSRENIVCRLLLEK